MAYKLVFVTFDVGDVHVVGRRGDIFLYIAKNEFSGGSRMWMSRTPDQFFASEDLIKVRLGGIYRNRRSETNAHRWQPSELWRDRACQFLR